MRDPESAGPASPRVQVRRHPERGRYDREPIAAILDEALLCHLGVVIDGDPLVLAHCSAALSLGAQAGKGPADLRSPASTVVDLRPWDAGGMPVVVREGAVPASEVVERIKHLR